MQKVIVVAHDAGGAQQLAAYIAKHRSKFEFISRAAGPARAIFARNKIRFLPAERSRARARAFMRSHANAAYALIAAPGWMTKTEISALEAAKGAGIRTVVYMDSWGGERERFGHPARGWKKKLPDSFWAGDTYERDALKKIFPHVPVRLVRNEYVEQIKERYRRLKRPHPSEILFVGDAVPGSERILDGFLASLPAGSRVRVRSHPADRKNRYDAVLEKHERLRIVKSNGADIVKDLVKAKYVVGPETAALAAALAVGKKTICLARLKREAFLPHRDLIRVRRPEDAVRLLR